MLSAAQPEMQPQGDKAPAVVQETVAERDARMQWWRDAKFGMFIHYGLYSGLAGEFKGVPGGGEWIQCNLGLDTDTYAAEALPLFCPAPGCTEAWAALAKEAGCRYMVLTSKHHEGFALFDAANSDYCTGKLLERDIVKEFSDSARRAGMKVGLYHSVIDWHQQDYDNTICRDLCYPTGQERMLREKQIPRNHAAYQEYLHNQVRQLVRNYGPIDIMWWDYSQGNLSGEAWKAQELMETCRAANPGVIFNNRLYAFSGFDAAEDKKALDFSKGDYSVLDDDNSKELVRALSEYKKAVKESAEKFEPYLVTRSVLNICGLFNKFYFENRILNAPEGVKEARLALTSAVRTVIKNGFGLLGIKVPEKM